MTESLNYQSNNTEKKYASVDQPWLQYFSKEDIEKPCPQCTMYHLVKHNCEINHAEKFIALHYNGYEVTYGEFLQRIDQYAAAFQESGITKGDYVSFLSVSTPETMYAIYGLNKIGAICNFIDVRTDAQHSREFIKKSGSTVLITLEMCFDKVADYLDELNLRLVLCQNPGKSLPFFMKILYKIKAPSYKLPYDGQRIIKIEEFAQRGEGKDCPEVEYEPNMPAAVTRTGGTTGISKGVVLTNDSLNAVANALYVMFFKDAPENSSFLNFLPVGVSYGIACGTHTALVCCCKDILIPNFDLNKFDDYIIKYRPNHVIAVPVFYDQLINSKKLKNKDLSFLFTLASGGDSANKAMEERQEKFRLAHNVKYPINTGYGLSETSSAVSLSFRNVHKNGSVGVPILGSTIAAFKRGTTEELPIGEKGELCITGPSIMKEYLNEPEETANVLWRHPDGKLWVHTGDYGYTDEDGFVYIISRYKRAIPRFDGHKMYPLQIENLVLQNDHVKRCVVIGVKDLDHPQGHLPIVIVEKKDDVTITDDELRRQIFDLCIQGMELRSQPVGVEFVDQIPLTKMGKNDYRALEKVYADYDYR